MYSEILKANVRKIFEKICGQIFPTFGNNLWKNGFENSEEVFRNSEEILRKF